MARAKNSKSRPPVPLCARPMEETQETPTLPRFPLARPVEAALVEVRAATCRLARCVATLKGRYQLPLERQFSQAFTYSPPKKGGKVTRGGAAREGRAALQWNIDDTPHRLVQAPFPALLDAWGYDLDRFHTAFRAWKSAIVSCRRVVDRDAPALDGVLPIAEGVLSVRLRVAVDALERSVPYDPEHTDDPGLPPPDKLDSAEIEAYWRPVGVLMLSVRSLAGMTIPAESSRNVAKDHVSLAATENRAKTGTPPSQSASDPASSGVGPIPEVADGEYQRIGWFNKNAASRIVMASHKDRKNVRVKAKLIDGVKFYRVADVERWFPDDLPKQPEQSVTMRNDA